MLYSYRIKNKQTMTTQTMTTQLNKGSKVKYNDMPGVITNVEDKGGRTFYSVKYKSTNGTRKAKGVTSTDGSITKA